MLLLMRILSTLPPEYKVFRTIWESMDRNQRYVEYLQERLTMVELRLNSANNTNCNPIST